MKWVEEVVKNNIAAILIGVCSVVSIYITMTKNDVGFENQITQLESYSKGNYAAMKTLQAEVRLLQLDMENQKVQLENVKGENIKLNQTLDKFSDSVNNLAQSVSALQALVQQQSKYLDRVSNNNPKEK